MEFDKDLAELEQAQRMMNIRKQGEQQGQGLWERIGRGVNRTAADVKKGADKIRPWVDRANPSAYEAFTEGEPKPEEPGLEDSMYAPYAEEYDSSKVGSSITGSSVMNPAAAAALYTGNTDQALANQFAGGATQYAADGGIMNAVMDNKGKFTPVQKGINDNPYLQAKNKGITGVL
jgi:hypothetical protein